MLTETYAWLPLVLKLTAIRLRWNFPLDPGVHRALPTEIETTGLRCRASLWSGRWSHPRLLARKSLMCNALAIIER
jgi:hypothetical protein